MALVNKSKNRVLEEKVKIASNFFSQAKGLMFESKKRFDYALVFPLLTKTIAGASIHCLFVFFPIDLIYLDENKKVVDIKTNIAPFTLYYQPKAPAKYFIELRAGKAGNTQLGDELEWSK